MSKRAFKRQQLFDTLLIGAGLGAAWEGTKILLVMLGWRERAPRTFEVDVVVCAALGAVLGVYVLITATRRQTAREHDRERTLASFHEKAERARAASVPSQESSRNEVR